jgi:hypothetical protein
MQSQFKQAEIVAALKQYIAAQGINTSGKSVEIAFSATRGAAGIVADVTIEDAAIPGFTDTAADDAGKPALSVVSSASTPSAESVQAEQSDVEETKPATPSNLFAGS